MNSEVAVSIYQLLGGEAGIKRLVPLKTKLINTFSQMANHMVNTDQQKETK